MLALSRFSSQVWSQLIRESQLNKQVAKQNSKERTIFRHVFPDNANKWSQQLAIIAPDIPALKWIKVWSLFIILEPSSPCSKTIQRRNTNNPTAKKRFKQINSFQIPSNDDLDELQTTQTQRVISSRIAHQQQFIRLAEEPNFP